jgi:hypothetical protein
MAGDVNPHLFGARKCLVRVAIVEDNEEFFAALPTDKII